MNATSPDRVIGIAGSLRRASFNRALLRAAVELAPQRLQIEVHEIAAIPLYNQDVEDVQVPAAVAELREAVRNADALSSRRRSTTMAFRAC